MKHMVWSGCSSWYLSEDGVNRSLYPGFAAEYVMRAQRLDASDYEIVHFQDEVAVDGMKGRAPSGARDRARPALAGGRGSG
jgi:hypothetical protein